MSPCPPQFPNAILPRAWEETATAVRTRKGRVCACLRERGLGRPRLAPVNEVQAPGFPPGAWIPCGPATLCHALVGPKDPNGGGGQRRNPPPAARRAVQALLCSGWCSLTALESSASQRWTEPPVEASVRFPVRARRLAALGTQQYRAATSLCGTAACTTPRLAVNRGDTSTVGRNGQRRRPVSNGPLSVEPASSRKLSIVRSVHTVLRLFPRDKQDCVHAGQMLIAKLSRHPPHPVLSRGRAGRPSPITYAGGPACDTRLAVDEIPKGGGNAASVLSGFACRGG
ncbi:hypothetical protein ColTof4_11149 [Colletotrichum tofieldiae]|nr:hypothetical protein ColTof3_04334 [Colletotrichum tofieldiae]GKT78726.1 hypothetical protein ColTof4_11149 [Colletotrichum tofieldiae]